jgi:hypothetical protein
MSPRLPTPLDLPTMGRSILDRLYQIRKMIMRAITTAALLAASVLLALLVLAPAQALAHSGHSHAVTNGPPPQVAPVRQEVPAPAPPHDEVTPAVDPAPSPASTTAPEHGHRLMAHAPIPDTKSCPGGCCQTAGPSCCPIGVLSVLAIFVPHLGQSTFPPLVNGGVGISPDTLPEPPKPLT